MGLFDLDRQILQENLFGVDLNRESVEITKLSLWLKTARRDKPLNNLDGNIRCGNSLVEPPGSAGPQALTEAFEALPEGTRPFDWRQAFPELLANGGFDVVVGNPPYVRQEALGPLFVLAAMNSPLLWAYMWRHAQHGKDEALRLFTSFTTTLPIAEPTQ